MKKSSFVYLIIIIGIFILSFLAIRYIIEVSAIRRLQLKIKNIEILEIKKTYANLKLNIEISNPTDVDIFQLSTDYDIIIADSIVGTGNMILTNVDAHTVKESSTTITLYYVNLAIGVIDTITSQNFSLTISGKLDTKVLFGLIPISQNFDSTYLYS